MLFEVNMYIITGASRGIGKFLLEEFLKRNQDVIGTYNKTVPEKNLDHYCKVDITNIIELQNMYEETKGKINNIILINSAGNNYNSFAHKANLTKWYDVINTNLVGTFNVIYTFLPTMRDQNFGRIINFSSVVAQSCNPGTSAYSASKSGLWGLAKSLAAENAKKNITINNLNLGYYNIGLISEVPEEYLNIVKSKIPSGKIGDPKNILNAIDFIVNSDYVNGASLDMNGSLI
jgi:NAD(P)-dependent dehydrogenase (short-subunit alcohol dehydrogenase family)